jgi:hypothetical protein
MHFQKQLSAHPLLHGWVGAVVSKLNPDESRMLPVEGVKTLGVIDGPGFRASNCAA